MITIEEIKKEYFRIEKLLGKTALTGDQYNLNCKKGFSVFLIKRDLGLTYNEVKTKIGAELASLVNNKGGAGSTKKIYCARGEGQMINIKNCLPGCNDVCKSCPSKQIDNVGAGGDTLTPE